MTTNAKIKCVDEFEGASRLPNQALSRQLKKIGTRMIAPIVAKKLRGDLLLQA